MRNHEISETDDGLEIAEHMAEGAGGGRIALALGGILYLMQRALIP